MVEWIDAFNDDGKWHDPDDNDLDPEVVIRTVGWIVRDTAAYLTVASSRDPKTGDFCNPMSIPKGCIRSTLPMRWA